jgi:hypothetical protein
MQTGPHWAQFASVVGLHGESGSSFVLALDLKLGIWLVIIAIIHNIHGSLRR